MSLNIQFSSLCTYVLFNQKLREAILLSRYALVLIQYQYFNILPAKNFLSIEKKVLH